MTTAVRKAPPPGELARRVAAGDTAAASRALSIIIDERDGFEELSKLLFEHAGKAHKIGVCGPPGSGKSSLVSALTRHLRETRKDKIGILAVDPSSPFTGGAFLGDRLRIQTHANDPGVFIRSVATRGAMGGVSATVFGAIHALEAWGCDTIFVETVGIGQDEVEIAKVVDTVALVTAPSLGDEIQAMKAGTMEIADLFIVNKSDLPGADKAVAHLKAALSLLEASTPRLGAHLSKANFGPAHDGEAPIVATSANTLDGIEALCAEFAKHRDRLKSSGEGQRRLRRQLREELAMFLARRVYDRTMNKITDAHIDALEAKAEDPVGLGARLLKEDA